MSHRLQESKKQVRDWSGQEALHHWHAQKTGDQLPDPCVDSDLQENVKGEKNLFLLSSCRQRLRWLVVQVLTDALSQVDEVIFPLQCSNIDIEQLLVNRRHRLAQQQSVLVVELPFSENELLEELQWVPNVCVQANKTEEKTSQK